MGIHEFMEHLMSDPRMDAALDKITILLRDRVSAIWSLTFLELLAVELLCSSADVKDQIAHEMLDVIRGG